MMFFTAWSSMAVHLWWSAVELSIFLKRHQEKKKKREKQTQNKGKEEEDEELGGKLYFVINFSSSLVARI